MQKNIQILTKKEIQAYIKENCTRVRPGFYRVDKPLKVWKKTRCSVRYGVERGIVALEIPVGATIHTQIFNGRFNGTQDQKKMRANVAIVRHQSSVKGLAQYEVAGWPKEGEYVIRPGAEFSEVQETYAGHDANFKYITGQSVKPNPNCNPWRAFDKPGACMQGIHFFVNLSEALSY